MDAKYRDAMIDSLQAEITKAENRLQVLHQERASLLHEMALLVSTNEDRRTWMAELLREVLNEEKDAAKKTAPHR